MVVWDVENQWEELDTPNARKAGLAWPENSGLDWNEKYAAWVGSLEQTEGQNGSLTFMMTTPLVKPFRLLPWNALKQLFFCELRLPPGTTFRSLWRPGPRMGRSILGISGSGMRTTATATCQTFGIATWITRT